MSTPAKENAIPENYREKFRSKEVVTKFTDPCEKAHKASMDCLNQNDYDRDKCTKFFEAYRECKGAWLQQRREDRQAGRPVR